MLVLPWYLMHVAILHCRSDVDELAECVMYCAWALKLLRLA